MSIAYKVEELLALRDSVSESAVSIDKFVDEDVIKEHVLRPSASVNTMGPSTDKNSRLSTTPGIATPSANKKPSPSPSVKRGKAERLLKEHGSPPGMRVTAGGRVVPSDLPPLGGVRFGNNNNFKPPTARGVALGNGASVQPQLDINNTPPNIELIGDQAIIRFGERLFAVPTDKISTVATPYLDNTMHPTDLTVLSAQGNYTNVPLAPQRNGAQTPYIGLDVSALKQQQALKKQELKTVEQTEVLEANRQTDAWRAGMIAKKKSLILELDTLRKQINVAQSETSKNEAASTRVTSMPLPNTMGPASVPPAPFIPQLQQPILPLMYSTMGVPMGMAPANQYPPLMMYQPYAPSTQTLPTEVSRFSQESRLVPTGENTTNANQLPATFSPTVNNLQSPGSASRRSHAIEIKLPHDMVKKQGSMLDPKSPTYEPSMKMAGNVEARKATVPPTPSPAKRSPWRPVGTASSHSDKLEERVHSQKPSLSSIDTTDFFPINTHEHSSTRIAPEKLSINKASSENTAIPSTPEKSRPAALWNPPSRSSAKSSGSNHPAPLKLASWPPESNKQSSLPRAVSRALADEVALATLRKTSSQQSSTNQSWPLIASNPIKHTPSTYQEGYQAGCDRMGLPDNVEVIRGFMQGLIHYLQDKELKASNSPSSRNAAVEGIDSRTSSFRNQLSGATLNDSAVSMNFPRVETSAAGLENLRSGVSNATRASVFKDMPYTSQGIGFEKAAKYSMSSDPTQDYRVPHSAVFPVVERETRKKSPPVQHRAEPFLSSSMFPRQISGNQLVSRPHGSPIAINPLYSYAKDNPTGSSTKEQPSPGKSAVIQRLSGLDGAMDDLAGIFGNTPLGGEKPPSESAEMEASCFRASSGKSKQKATSSPAKYSSGKAREQIESSPTLQFGSPTKTNERSPAKAKLGQVTNKLRRQTKDSPHSLSPEEKKERTKKWQYRFRVLRQVEADEHNEYLQERGAEKRAEKREGQGRGHGDDAN